MARELPEGTVTVLVTDVEGSTDLVTRLLDEAAREVQGGRDGVDGRRDIRVVAV